MTKSKTETIVETPIEDVELPTPPTEHTEDNASIRPKSSFGKTYYFIDLTRTREKKAPGQLQGMIRWMIDNDVTSPENAMQGAEIGIRAVDDGYVATQKLTGPVIFAYYVRRMEKYHGVEHAKTIHAKTGRRMN